jgi:hypothetical protein
MAVLLPLLLALIGAAAAAPTRPSARDLAAVVGTPNVFNTPALRGRRMALGASRRLDPVGGIKNELVHDKVHTESDVHGDVDFEYTGEST